MAAVLHFWFEFYVTPGYESFASKVVICWIGAWLGSSVFGHWPHRIAGLHYDDVWFLPAILGAVAMIIVAVDLVRMLHVQDRPRRRR